MAPYVNYLDPLLCPSECNSSIVACYKHCSSNRHSFVKFYVGDSTTFNDATNTLCGDAVYEYNTLNKGTILCDRATTAAYVHIVAANDA